MALVQPMTTITAAAVAVWLVQKLKAIPWLHWIEEGKPLANRIAGIVVATASAVGISIHYSGAAHTLTIGGLTLAGIIAAGWAWIKQFAAQEMIYQVTSNQPRALAVGEIPQGLQKQIVASFAKADKARTAKEP